MTCLSCGGWHRKPEIGAMTCIFLQTRGRRLAVHNTLELSGQNCSRSFQNLAALVIGFNDREVSD
jgi:hypothetical protein